ncbi:hypothetical protein [Streptomyces sp. NPDC091217]|uniref:hypothetical protein n=1 Tax=Streptomyces sp. NPDC091217 TaxID=3365975 RepID=UPI0037F86181
MPDNNQPHRPTPLIESRVCIDDDFGPFDAKLDPTDRLGYLNPFFSLETVRELAVLTQRMFIQYGRDGETIHVIPILHVVDSRTDREEEPRPVVIHIRWPHLDEDVASAVSIIQPNDDGLYRIGDGLWAWAFVTWSCPCSSDTPWHVTRCQNCGALRHEAASADTADDRPLGDPGSH